MTIGFKLDTQNDKLILHNGGQYMILEGEFEVRDLKRVCEKFLEKKRRVGRNTQVPTEIGVDKN